MRFRNIYHLAIDGDSNDSIKYGYVSAPPFVYDVLCVCVCLYPGKYAYLTPCPIGESAHDEKNSLNERVLQDLSPFLNNLTHTSKTNIRNALISPPKHSICLPYNRARILELGIRLDDSLIQPFVFDALL